MNRQLTKPLIVIPLAKWLPGSYIDRLFCFLKKNHNVESIGISLKAIPYLITVICRRPIIHLHWIEHKYTFGVVSKFGSLSKSIVLFTAPAFLLFILVLKHIFNCPIVTTLHNVIPHKVLFPRLERCVFKAVLRMSDLIYIHTQNSKIKARLLYDIPDSKFRKIPHGNWIPSNRRKCGREEARRILDISSKAFVMCFIGRISSDKGLHLFLDALKEASDINKPLCLIIAGNPFDEKYLCSLLKKSASLPPIIEVRFYAYWIPDSSIPIFMDACDIGVVPYQRTTTPSSVLLFMSFAKSVIAPAIPEIKELINGLDFPLYETIECLNSVIKRTIDMRQELHLLGAQAQKRAQLFDWNKTAEITYMSYLELYE